MKRYVRTMRFVRVLALTAMPVFMVFLPAALPSNQAGIANAEARIDSAEESMTPTVLDNAHDVGLTGCVVEGLPPVHLSDTAGTFMFVQCQAVNLSGHDDMVEITKAGNLILTTLPAGCVADGSLIVPGRSDFILLTGEQKQLLYKVRFECHSPAVESIIPFTIQVAIDHIVQPDGLDDENPANDSLTFVKSLIISPADGDADGFTSVSEEQIGTRADKPCGQDGWPADLVDAGASFNRLDLLDLSSFIAPVRRLGTSPGDTDFSARWDLVPGAAAGPFINAQDIASLLPGNTTSTAWPPMLDGAAAFNQTCPWPP